MNVALRQDAQRILEAAIAAVLPDEAVRRALAGRRFPGRVFLVAAGKAAWRMARAAVEELDTPLVMHCGVNASIANRFAYLLENGRPVYRYATVTDGGVCVSLLCDSVQSAPRHVFQQKQDTYYYLLPDNTWLTVLPLEDTTMTCWVRLRADRAAEEAETAEK